MDRFVYSAFAQLKASWVILLLLGGITWVTAYSLDHAGWVRGDHLISTSVFWGLLFGWLLSVSRINSRGATVYSLAISILAVGIAMSGLVPTIWEGIVAHTAFPDLLNLMNIRMWILLYRINAWFSAIWTHVPVGDTGFFIYLLSLTAWNSTTWFAWSCLRNCQSFPGVIIYGLFLGLNIQLSGQSIWQFWFFLGLAIMLIIRNEYLTRQRDWDARGIDYPDETGYEWGGAALGMAVIITSLALMTSVIGTHEGWKILSDLLTTPREKTSETAERLFSGVTPPKKDRPELFARTPDLQNFANPLPVGKDVILWVKTSDPPPPRPEAPSSARPRKRYWRSEVYSNYTAGGWELLPLPKDKYLPENEAIFPERIKLVQHFDLTARNDQRLYASNSPVEADESVILYQDTATATVLASGKTVHYQITSLVPSPSATQLEQVSGRYPGEIERLYLALPSDLPPRVKRLTDQITAGAASPYQKAVRIQNYLRSTYPYDLEAEAPPTGRDFVDFFLFESQRGYCTHYATAMTVMLRLEGVPARAAAGYSMGTFDYDRQAYKVIVEDAHVWVEIYFPEYGWIEFEPTPVQSVFDYGQASEEETLSTAPSEPAASSQIRQVDILASILALALLAAVGIAASRRRQHLRPDEDSPTGKIYWEIRTAFEDRGIRSLRSATPNEYLQVCAAALPIDEDLQQVLQDATALYVRAVYSPKQPDSTEVTAVLHKWRHVRWRWLVYTFKHDRVELMRKFNR